MSARREQRSYTAVIERALRARRDLLADADLDVCRVFNGRADGIEGLVVERFGPVLVAQLHEGRLAIGEDDARAVCTALCEQLKCTAVYLKRFVKDRSAALADVEPLHTDPQPWFGSPTPAEITVKEHGVRHVVRPFDGYSVGLFLDHRDNRRRVREIAAGRRVLNTFSYTCGYSVCAALAGAAETVSVDVSRKYLAWGRENFAANGVPLDGQFFINSDVFAYFERAERQGRRFDLIILDPPSFGRDKRSKRVFVVEDQLEPLVADAARLLDPGGVLLLSCNHRAISADRLVNAIESTGDLRVTDQPALPADFAGDVDLAKSVWARRV